MTKVRPPLSFELAMTKVAGLIGWPEVAKICGFAENTVRNWSDQDTTAKLPLEGAFRLDMAFQRAGGEGAPFLHCYATRVKAEMLEVSVDRRALLAGAGIVAKESGEAIAATLAAADPNATTADIIVAERELEESITSKSNLLTAIRTFGKSLTNRGEPQMSAIAPPNTS